MDKRVPSRSLSVESPERRSIMKHLDRSLDLEGPSQIEGKCIDGDRCAHLKRVADLCQNIQKLISSGRKCNGIDETYDLDHSLFFHSDFRRPGGCSKKHCPSLQNRGGSGCYVQFHRQIYHDASIGAIEEDEEKRSKQRDDKIEYKKMYPEDQIGRIEFGQPFNLITDKFDAKWKDPKQEMLKNDYHKIDAAEWNELLRKCMVFAKSREAKVVKLTLKEIVALKLYTDCDDLQRQFRRCFREPDREERGKLQKNFFHWNNLLESACEKGRYRVKGKLYHGVNDKTLLASSFNGTYYGMYLFSLWFCTNAMFRKN